MWNEAYKNTTTIVIHHKLNGITEYKKGCKECNTTEYKSTTREMQRIGNCYQRIVICECNKSFIEEWI